MAGAFLTEGEVIDAVVRHLMDRGWSIRQTRTVKQRGIDILAERDGSTITIEAKGGGSSQDHTGRYGRAFTAGR